VSGETGSNQPEPLEDRIAHAIESALEPFVVSLLAALIAPSQCVQGIDQERDDQRRKAIELGRMLLNESPENLKSAYDRIEQYNLAMEAHRQKQTLSPAEEWLYLDMKLGDDSFGRYLREAGAPGKIQNRDAIAHFRAFKELGLGGLLIADRSADEELFGFHVSKRTADQYLKAYRKSASDAEAKRRKKLAKKNRRSARKARFPKK
jgi:hypothetical protein